MDHEEYVRAKIENPHFITSYNKPDLWRLSIGFGIASADTQDHCWEVAAMVVKEHEEEIRRVEEERAWLRAGHSENNPACVKRILARTEAHLADLRKGMK